MNIKKRLQNINTFCEMEDFVKKIEVKVSFWGARYISINSNEVGNIDDLADRVLQLIKTNPNFSEKERTKGKIVSEKITNYYDFQDNLIKNGNFITRIFVVLRELVYFSIDNSPNCSLIRWNWRDCEYYDTSFFIGHGYYKIFDYYTKKQFEEVFGSDYNDTIKIKFSTKELKKIFYYKKIKPFNDEQIELISINLKNKDNFVVHT